MATVRTAEELRCWNFQDWTYVMSDWDCLVEEGFMDYLGNLTDDCDIDGLIELLTDKGYETQEDVDQLWLDIHDAQNRLGMITDGFAKVAPTIFGDSEGGTDNGDY